MLNPVTLLAYCSCWGIAFLMAWMLLRPPPLTPSQLRKLARHRRELSL